MESDRSKPTSHTIGIRIHGLLANLYSLAKVCTVRNAALRLSIHGPMQYTITWPLPHHIYFKELIQI